MLNQLKYFKSVYSGIITLQNEMRVFRVLKITAGVVKGIMSNTVKFHILDNGTL